ncbi:MAG: acetoin utilization protein AcuB [Psychromonas sp.]|jgi:acetoin utilization protein AcuB
MTAEQLITEEIPPLLSSDSGEKALTWMEEFKVSHLPVLKNGNYVGSVSETLIFDCPDASLSLDELFQHLPRPYVVAGSHIYEVLSRLSEFKVTVLPVLDHQEKYLGSTTVYQLMKLISNTGSIKETGGILVLEMNAFDYSMAEISQIIESNNAKILSSYIMSSPDSTKTEVTLKINQVELESIIRTFERYDYTIKASFQKGKFDDDLQFKFDALMNYLKL